MKKISNKKIIGICIAVIICVIGMLIYYYIEKPEEQVERKYAGNKEHVLIKEVENEPYQAFLSKDDENLYLDVFKKNKYQGGGEVKLSNIGIFNVRQEDTLIVIYGDNSVSKFKEYDLSIKGEGVKEKKVEKVKIKDDYILDIYIFEKEYNNYPDLELKKD